MTGCAQNGCSDVRVVMLTQRRVIKPEVIHPAVIDCGGRLTLVDCGDPELAHTLLDEMRQKGLSAGRVTDIIVTHHDLDHMGGLSQLQDTVPNVNVMATAVQAAYIRGERRWLRLQREDAEYLAQPPERRVPSSRVRAEQYRYFLPGRVDTLLEDADTLPNCGGCQVVVTPWHMPGHISLYIPALKTLIAGDALNTFDGMLGLNSRVDLCPELTGEGLKSLAALEVETVCGYHGGLLRLAPGEFARQLDRLRVQIGEKT